MSRKWCFYFLVPVVALFMLSRWMLQVGDDVVGPSELSPAGGLHETKIRKSPTTKLHKEWIPAWNCTEIPGDCYQRSSTTCHRTKVSPFRAGCPATCPATDQGTTTSEPLFRLYMAWYFGQPSAYRNSTYPKQYAKGVNFRCPNVFVEHFARASQILKELFQVALSSTTTNLVIKPQEAMHISLAYLCCLRKDEASKAVQLMHEWVERQDFSFSVKFDRLECWHEHPNSVTNILLVDEKTQHTLMGILRELETYLKSHGIPIVIPRTDQMPFHTTILGVQYNKNPAVDESDDPDDDMTPRLAEIHSIVSALDQSTRFSADRIGQTERSFMFHTNRIFLPMERCTPLWAELGRLK